jgi:hypothetical protein
MKVPRWLWVTAVLVLAGVTAAVVVSRAMVRSVAKDESVGMILVSADGLTLAGSDSGCGLATLEVAETRDTVTVWLRRYPDLTMAPGICAIRSFTAQLHSPVGSRRLVDGVTHRSLPAFDGKGILRPAQLPAGFVHRYDTASFGDESVVHSTVGCVQIYSTDESYDKVILIAQDVGATWSVPEGAVEVPVTVRGHPGTAIPGELEWSESGQLFTIRSMSYAYATLSAEQLLAIAESLR